MGGGSESLLTVIHTILLFIYYLKNRWAQSLAVARG
jgi:hypothetical protein